MKHLILAAAAALALVACDSGGTATETAPAPAPVAAAPAPAPEPEPEPVGMPGLTAPYATEAEWTAACTAVPLDATVCDCVGKATTATLGAPAYYTWVWEAYVQRNAIAQNRSKRWLEENSIDEAGAKKFTDAVGKCYVTQ
jgi:hypothetical protein